MSVTTATWARLTINPFYDPCKMLGSADPAQDMFFWRGLYFKLSILPSTSHGPTIGKPWTWGTDFPFVGQAEKTFRGLPNPVFSERLVLPRGRSQTCPFGRYYRRADSFPRSTVLRSGRKESSKRLARGCELFNLMCRIHTRQHWRRRWRPDALIQARMGSASPTATASP